MYKISISGFNKYFPLIMLAVILFGGSIFAKDVFNDEFLFGKIFVVFWFAVLIYNAYNFFKMPVEMTIYDNGLVKLKDILNRESEIMMSEIVLIQMRNSTLLIKTKNQKITGFGEYDGFSRFVEDVKKFNPGVITKGC